MDEEQQKAESTTNEITRRRLAYLEDYRTTVTPSESRGAASFEASRIFAEIAVRSAYLLNGGAMVALPAFWAMISNDLRITLSDLSEPAGWFFWGLVAAVVANITIYFNYLSLMQVMRQVTEHANAKLKFAYYGEGLKPDQKVPTTPFDSIERFTFFVALAVVIASFLFFYWGADTLMEAIKTVYDDPDLKLPIPSSRPN